MTSKTLVNASIEFVFKDYLYPSFSSVQKTQTAPTSGPKINSSSITDNQN